MLDRLLFVNLTKTGYLGYRIHLENDVVNTLHVDLSYSYVVAQI